MNILIADNEKDIIEILSMVLIDYCPNIKIFTARDGNEAIDIINNNNIDTLLTDIHMPNLDGFGLLAYLKVNNIKIKTVVLSAFYNTVEIKSLNSCGISVLNKPIDFDELYEKLGLTNNTIAA